jgi:hypothetical protein
LQMDAPDTTAVAAAMELSGDDDLAGTQTWETIGFVVQRRAIPTLMTTLGIPFRLVVIRQGHPPRRSQHFCWLQIRGGKTRTVNDDEKVLLQCSVFGFSPLLDNTTQATSGESMIDWKISVVWFILVSDCLLLLVWVVSCM